MAAGGILSALSGGTIAAVVAALAAVAVAVTTITGGIVQAAAPTNYSKQIDTLEGHRDRVGELSAEYQALAGQQSRTEEEGKRMDAILRQLAGSSLALNDALTDSTGGFLNQTEAIKAMNGYLLETEERLSSLKREQANNAFKDLGD